MDHGAAATTATSASASAAAAAHTSVQWPLLAAIAVATCLVCLAATLLPCGCFRLLSRSASAKRSPEETEAQRLERLRRHQRRVAMATGCLTSLGAGVILATCFIGLMPAAASAYVQLCAGAPACLAAASLGPPAGSLAFCLLFWLARSLIERARRRGDGDSDGETKRLVSSDSDSTTALGGTTGPATSGVGATATAAAVGCCAAADAAADPTALQDTTTAVLITAALLLKAIVEGLALPAMLRVASPLFVGLGKCLHEACCGLVLGLAWSETVVGAGSGSVGRWGLAALVAYAVAASGSILLGGLTASVHSVAGTAVQFALLIAASGAGLQASFVHILPRLPEGPASPALVLAGMLLMTLVAGLHHLLGGGGHHG